MQDGKVPEFIDKENKWFNNIIGFDYDSISNIRFKNDYKKYINLNNKGGK